MKKHSKILEIGGEGGSVTLYEKLDGRNIKTYYHSTDEMSMEEDGETINQKSTFSSSVAEALIKMQLQYPNIFSLYPLEIHKQHKEIILKFLTLYAQNREHTIDVGQWAQLFELESKELYSILQGY